MPSQLVCRLSACLSVTFCILAKPKRYALGEKTFEGANKDAPGDYPTVPSRTPIPQSSPNGDYAYALHLNIGRGLLDLGVAEF